MSATVDKWAEVAKRAHCGYATVETQVWEPNPDMPEGYVRLVRTKSVEEVHQELRSHLGETDEHGFWAGEGLEEYFSVLPGAGTVWPADGRVVVHALRGGSEGDYVHVAAVSPEGGYRTLILGKTFCGREAAWAAAKRIADLLGV